MSWIKSDEEEALKAANLALNPTQTSGNTSSIVLLSAATLAAVVALTFLL